MLLATARRRTGVGFHVGGLRLIRVHRVHLLWVRFFPAARGPVGHRFVVRDVLTGEDQAALSSYEGAVAYAESKQRAQNRKKNHSAGPYVVLEEVRKPVYFTKPSELRPWSERKYEEYHGYK